MELAGKHVVVTGGGSGIGRAMCVRFGSEAARVTVADLDRASADVTTETVADAGGEALAVTCDVSVEAQIVALVERAEAAFGPIDLFCSNAGIAVNGGPDAPNEDWERSWLVNTMSHVWAARAVLPGMLARGEGYLLQTASAAGLLTNIGTAPYSVTKHAAVGLAEWLAISYGDQGIKVSCLCPQGVRTPMLMGSTDDPAGAVVLASGDLLEPEDVADAVVTGLADERFLILPHPIVGDYLKAKVADYDRWLHGMRRLQARLTVGP
ncbi:MAG TPA: SDR family oxidoreductase [Acidimicrobiales bacterium]|jgi:NAD(P)-dependent dehydrogenase (short-subunit alcohol dehydrogenase family)